MINPSVFGWFDKYISELELSAQSTRILNERYYSDLRNTGFIYGHVIAVGNLNTNDFKNWTSEEVSKIALLNALWENYTLNEIYPNKNDFSLRLHHFYNHIHPQGFSFLKKILPNESISNQIEKIIDYRVQTNKNIISKNFSHIVTNALLYIDVLAFQHYCIHKSLSTQYTRKLEEVIVSVVSLALSAKSETSQYDELLIKLFETSVRYTKFDGKKISDLHELDLSVLEHEFEKLYVIDLAAMAIWNDRKLDKSESEFLFNLGIQLKLKNFEILESLTALDTFIQKYKSTIPYFNYSNPIKHFYDQTTQTVVKLINRNKKRLVKEISQSKELLVLLAYSTQRELDKSEKKRMKKQLLDICKTIPSLTIFLLPGGSLLLPILIKFIPQILPSAFNENLED